MTLVTFADLTHTGKVIDANQFPLAIGFVSAVLKQTLKDQVDVQLFKFPNEFAEFLETNEPKIACFSNYMWHERLHREFAIRIKQRYPKVITVFGGPNFPTDDGEQRTYLEKHPEIDFYIDGVSVKAVQDYCDEHWPHSVGYGSPRGFVHVGIRPNGGRIRWNY